MKNKKKIKRWNIQSHCMENNHAYLILNRESNKNVFFQFLIVISFLEVLNKKIVNVIALGYNTTLLIYLFIYFVFCVTWLSHIASIFCLPREQQANDIPHPFKINPIFPTPSSSEGKLSNLQT